MSAQAVVTGVPVIPAMTTDAERALYYRLAKEAAGKGAIVELGAWLGASTAWIAAGIRDSGFATKAQVYDRFLSKPGHVKKVETFFARHGGEQQVMPIGSCFEQFMSNLGLLLAYVEPHQGEIADIKWSNGPIAAMITDAPKRVPQISAVLTAFREALVPGAVIAWQDFCHFPSYEIPACLYRLRDHFELEEAVVPGTTLAFRVVSQWTAAEVSRDALALASWTPLEIADAWYYWLEQVPAEKRGLFQCGRAMFLCDIGEPGLAVQVLAGVYEHHAAEIVKKWRYLNDARAAFRDRYRPLFDFLADQDVFAC